MKKAVSALGLATWPSSSYDLHVHLNTVRVATPISRPNMMFGVYRGTVPPVPYAGDGVSMV